MLVGECFVMITSMAWFIAGRRDVSCVIHILIRVLWFQSDKVMTR